MNLSRQTNSIFSALAHPYRRETVTILTETSEPIPIDELSQAIVRSGLVQSDNHDSESVEAIRIQLHHCHLPKLADAGLIEYDSEANLISSTPVTPHLIALNRIAYAIAEVM